MLFTRRQNGRGWTYQERFLSRRHAFFGKRQIFLNCYHERRNEHKIVDPYENVALGNFNKRKKIGDGFEHGLVGVEYKKGDFPFYRYAFMMRNYTMPTN